MKYFSQRFILKALVLFSLFLVSACSTFQFSDSNREPQSLKFSCLHALQKIFDEDFYRSRLQIIEDEARRENFNALDGLAEAKTNNPRLWWRIRGNLRKLEGDGLSRFEVEDLVSDLYRLAHPESHVKKWIRGGYEEVKTSYIIDSISKRLLTRNMLKTFEEVGLMKDPSLFEAIFQLNFRQEFKAFQLILAAWGMGQSFANGMPLVVVPGVDLVKHFEIPDEIIEKIMKEGINSAYTDLERLYGRRGDFTVLWREFQYFTTYASFVAVVGYAAHHGYKQYQDVEKKSVEGLEDRSGGENRNERSARVKQQLEIWKKQYRENNGGREPTQEEENSYARVLRIYGRPGR